MMDKKWNFTFKVPSTDPKYLSLYKWPTPKTLIVPDLSGITQDSVKDPQGSKGQEGQARMVETSSARSSTRLAGPSTLKFEPGITTISELNGHFGTDVVVRRINPKNQPKLPRGNVAASAFDRTRGVGAMVAPGSSGMSGTDMPSSESAEGQRSKIQKKRPSLHAIVQGLHNSKTDGEKTSARELISSADLSALPIESVPKTLKRNEHFRTDDEREGVIVPTKKQNDGKSDRGNKIRMSPNRPTVILPVAKNNRLVVGGGLELENRDTPIGEQIRIEKENDESECSGERFQGTSNTNTLNFDQPLSNIMTNLVNHPTLQMDADKNKSSTSEIVENSAIFFQMLEKMADVIVGMPDNTLEQLSGYDIVKHNKIILMTTKLKSLLNKNIDVIETRQINNTENAQPTDEIMNCKADSSPAKYKSSTSTSVLTDNNMTSIGISNSDVNNETKITENDNNNDIAANCRASTSKSFFDNNDTIVTVTNDNILDNDVNNETDVSERDNFNVLTTSHLASTSKSVFNHNDGNETENIRKNIYNDSTQHSLASTSKSFLINDNDKVINNDPQTNDVSTEKTTREIHNDLIQENLAVTSKYFLDRNDDAVINRPPNDDLNETETREIDINNDLANDILTGPSGALLALFDNNDNIDFNKGLTNNDVSNNTETRERDINNDLAANILNVKKEIHDILNEECVLGNKNYPKQDSECIVISDNDSASDSTEILKDSSDHNSRDEMESTTDQPENVSDHNNDVELVTALDNNNIDQKSSERARNSSPPTFDEDDDEEWKRLVSQLNELDDDDDLNENETDIKEDANVDNVQSNTKILNALKTIFKFNNFKKGQEQVIRGVVEYEYDCLIIMATGSGKSLCYQLPAVLSKGVTIVVCPLQSLIQDQIQMLKSLNIKVEHLSGKLKKAETERIYTDLKSDTPTIKLLYVTPEKLHMNGDLKDILAVLYARNKISRFVIDEAHCISALGHEFRPAYRRLGELRRRFPRAPLSALSASAGPRTRDDIIEQLHMQNCEVYCMSLDRPSLSYNVLEKTDTSFHDVAEMIRTNYMGQSCIVYCLDARDTEKMAEILISVGVRARAYYAKMDPITRMEAHSEWQTDICSVICATSAFGLGIDKARVRLVVHLGLPGSLAQYSQEAGRAGRGASARCLLYYSPRDEGRYARRQNTRNLQNQGSPLIDNNKEELSQVVAFCQNKTKCRRLQILEYFDDSQKVVCGKTRALCDNCVRKMGNQNTHAE